MAWKLIPWWLLLVLPMQADGQAWSVEAEAGWVAPGRNDIRVPNSGGTLFSLRDDLPASGRTYGRLRLSRQLGQRHELSALFAPLTLRAEGALPTAVDFAGSRFAAGEAVDASYRFNSYRLTYRYRLLARGSLRLWAGLTAKVRDAEIRLRGSAVEARESNVGFVPLLHVLLEWSWGERHGLRLEADAAAARQGRAEDIALSVHWDPAPRWRLRLGYRLVEGGADVPKVYNFAWINYLFAGAGFRF